MARASYVPSLNPLLYHYAFNFNALATVHPEQYPVWLHAHAQLLKHLAETRRGYVAVGVYLKSLHTIDLFNAAKWYRDRIDDPAKPFDQHGSSELTHVAMTHAAMVAHMEGATFVDDHQLSIAADRLVDLVFIEATTRLNDFTNTIIYEKASLDPDVNMSQYVRSRP